MALTVAPLQVRMPVRAPCPHRGGGLRAEHPPAYEFAGASHSDIGATHSEAGISHSDSGPWASSVKVPATTAETSHPYPISDAREGGHDEREEEEEVTSSGATRSAHYHQQVHEGRDDSTTPDTEDYFSKGKAFRSGAPRMPL